MTFWTGPTNAIDFAYLRGMDAREASFRLGVPLWVCVERWVKFWEESRG